jgi:tetratricopeptide (TPR) repeat protein
MGADGQSATCKTCGMEYSVERVRELMALDTVAVAPQADRQEQATTCVLFDDYHAVLLELFEEHTGISAADMSLDEEELEHAVFDMIPLASKVSTIDFGDYAIIATTKGVMTKVLDAAMRKTLSRYKKGQRGAKLWCRIFLSTHYRDEFIQFVLPDNVLWEVSGLSEGTLEQAVAELQQELPFGIALKGRNDIVQNTAPTPALQEDVLEATWEETSDADVAAQPPEMFHMTGKCEYYGSVIRGEESSANFDVVKAIALCEKADAAYNRNSIGKAISYLEEALRYDADNYIVWNKLGRAYRALSYLDEARKCYQKALEIKPGAIDVIANIGVLEFSCNNYQLAYQYCKQAFEVGGATRADNAVYAANYAMMIAKIGDKEEALRVLEIARKRGYRNYTTLKRMIRQN